MNRTRVLISAAIVLLAIGTRLYRIHAPVADWHSFRQADTASVARNYLKYGFDLLRPRYDDLSNIQSGKDNPMGWRMVELPLYQYTAALGKRIIGVGSIEVWLRAVSIAAVAGTALILISLAGEIISPVAGMFAGFFYAVLPYSVYYGRAILPETYGVWWGMLSVFLVYRGYKEDKKNRRAAWLMLVAAAGSGAVALLVKPTTAFLLVPIPYLIYRSRGFSVNSFIRVFVYSCISLLPLLWWRSWISQYPEGIPVFAWLLNEGNIRFKGAWFWWMFAERLGKLILGYWGMVLFGLGMIVRPRKAEGWLVYWMGIGILAYISVFAAGNVRHDYYQIVAMPFIAIMLAKGLAGLLELPGISIIKKWGMGIAVVLFTVGFSWYTVRTYYWINRPDIVEAGRTADAVLPPEAKVIAPYNGDTSFLYQTNRPGWPLGFDIDKKIAMGATHYVTVSPTDDDWETKELAEKYTVLVRNEKFAIIDLTKMRVKRKE